MSSRPTLAPPRPEGPDGYIKYYGAELYYGFCRELGIVPMEYWSWDKKTRERGVDWWHKELLLEDIKSFPPPDDYRMLVRTAHPDEADGPSRLKHFIRAWAQGTKPNPWVIHDMLWNRLGGREDPQWYIDAKQAAFARC